MDKPKQSKFDQIGRLIELKSLQLGCKMCGIKKVRETGIPAFEIHFNHETGAVCRYPLN